MNWLTVILLVQWLVCPALTFGMTLAHIQSKYPAVAFREFREDCGQSVVFALFCAIPFIGILLTFVMFCVTGFAEHGLIFRRSKSNG